MGLLDKVLNLLKPKTTSGDGPDPAKSSLTVEDAQEYIDQSISPSAEFKEKQKARFRRLYGRNPVPGQDPLFFDPDTPVPTMMTAERMKAVLVAKMTAVRTASGGSIPEPTSEDRAALGKAVSTARDSRDV